MALESGRVFFPTKTEMKELAFGKVPSFCRYDLYMERHRCTSDFIRAEHRGRDGLRILDVGSGPGLLKRFCDFGNIEWHGVDNEPGAIRNSASLGYAMNDLDVERQTLPYPDGHFDVVNASHVLEHIKNLGFCMGEMSRVLKAGGILVVGMPVKPLLTHHLLRLYHSLTTRRKGITAQVVDVNALKRLLRAHLGREFRIVDLRGFRFLSARTRANWENHLAFYKANVWFGKRWPWLTREVNVVLRKNGPPRTASAATP